MITVLADPDTGRVLRIGTADATIPPGAVEVPSLPIEPTPEPGHAVSPFLADGALVWRQEPLLDTNAKEVAP